MKQWIMLLTVLFGAFSQLKAQQRYELTVKEAVDLAFKNLTDVKNAQLDYRIQEAQNKEITGRALPQISGNVGANHYIELPKILFPDATATAVYGILKQEGVKDQNGNPITNVPDPTMRQVSFQQPWNLTGGLTLQQLLFQPDVFVGLKARQTALNLSKEQLELVKERVKDSAYKKFYAILIAEKQLFFLNEGVNRLQKLYNDDSVMFKNGFVERLDLDKVQVQLTNLQTTRNIVDNSVKLAYAALKFSLGLSQKDTVVIKEELSISKVKEGILDESFSYTDRPEIRVLENAKKLQQLDLKRYQLGYLPTVAAQANYTVNGMGQKFFTDKNTTWIRSSFVGVNINVPIFDGFQRKSKVQQSKFNVEKADNSLTYVKQAIDFEQVVLKETLKNSLLNLDAQQRNMELAERVFNTTKIKFQEGLGSSFEVLQADADYQTAQANYFSSLYNAIVAKISYQRSLGKLQ
jgi:outer membrane protein